MFRSNDSKNYVFIKNNNQLKKVFKATKLKKLKELNIFSFKSSQINLPIIDLSNFQNLQCLKLKGHFFENNIFIVMLQNKIVLKQLEYLSAPYVHLNIINQIFPNLKHIKATHLLMPVFEEVKKETSWTKFEHVGFKSCPMNILIYLVQRAPLIEELQLTLSDVTFVLSYLAIFNKLKKLHLNITIDNFNNCLEQLESALPSIIDRNIQLKLNGLPFFDIDQRVFVDYPFKTNYHNLCKNYDIDKEDLRYFFDNFRDVEILERSSAKIKSLKKFNLNNVSKLKYKCDENSKYLISKFFVRIPNLEHLIMFKIELLQQEQINSLTTLWPNLMSIDLSASSMLKLDTKFLESFKNLSEIKFENLNFLNETNFKFVIRRLIHLNQLITINCLFNLKNTYLEFMKKSKHKNVQFVIDLNNKYKYSNLSKWTNEFNI